MTDSSQDKQSLDLKSRVEKLQGQKDTLLRELEQVEERLEKTDGLYRKYFPYILDLIKDDGSKFSDPLKDLGTALRKGSPLSRIEYIFKQIQEAILKESPETDGGKKGARSLLAGLFKPSVPDYIDEYRQGYIHVIDSLKAVLDPVYIEKLNTLSSRIAAVSDSREIGAIRNDLFEMLLKYISDVGADREKIAAFLQDIVKRILDIEASISQSYSATGEAVKVSEGFSSLIGSEIGSLKNQVAVSETLEELKIHVSGTLSTIENALKKKTVKDKALREFAEKNSQTFKTGFAKLKKELDQATSHSRELEKKLNQDPLTGAYNRRAYNKRIEDELQRFLRYGTVFSLLLLDADHFKKVNDTYGHAIGDKCLQEIIRRSGPHLRKSDMLARYGGEEFVVIMPETNGDGALIVAEKIRQTIEKIEFIYREETVKVTVSIGATQVREGDATSADIFDRADVAVYKAKEQGRNRVVLN
ncbi:MAG: GGDEF domain-containing protein [Pseudomonadota bacterium]